MVGVAVRGAAPCQAGANPNPVLGSRAMEPLSQQSAQQNDESVEERPGQRPAAKPPQFDPAFRERLYDLFRWRRDVRRFKRVKLPTGTIVRLISIALPRSV